MTKKILTLSILITSIILAGCNNQPPQESEEYIQLREEIGDQDPSLLEDEYTGPNENQALPVEPKTYTN